MSQFDVDIPDDAFDAPAETPEPVETPAAEAPAAPAETTAPEAPAAPAETAEPKSFPEEYVKELRQESANYRTKAKPFVEAFDGIDESDRDVFLGLANLYKTDPIAAGREMARLAQGLVGDDDTPAAAPVSNGEKLTPYMTRADYEAIRQQEALEAATRQIESEAKSLGYDTASPEYNYLLAVAKQKDGSITAAHEYIQARESAAVSKYLEQKTKEAEGAPTAPTQVSAPASTERSLKTWRDVEAAIDELF